MCIIVARETRFWKFFLISLNWSLTKIRNYQLVELSKFTQKYIIWSLKKITFMTILLNPINVKWNKHNHFLCWLLLTLFWTPKLVDKCTLKFYMFDARFELATFRVLGGCDNQLHQPNSIICSMPGSNWRPSACKADVITNYTNRTTWQEWDLNPRPFGLEPYSSILDRSIILSFTKIFCYISKNCKPGEYKMNTVINNQNI